VREDPIGHLDPTLPAEDFEVASFIVAGLAYGRVEQIQKSVKALFERFVLLGIAPNSLGLKILICEVRPEDLKKVLKGWVHRMNTGDDITSLCMTLQKLLLTHGSLCAAYQKSFDENPQKQLEQFCALFEAKMVSKTKKWRGTGLSWFACSPANGTTCKRLQMWLRWMVRKDHLDPGTWHSPILVNAALPKPCASRLFFPVDTHIFNWSKEMGITKRNSPNWKCVEEITEFFRKLHPEDPVKYDFAICHMMMRRFRS